MSHVLHFIKVVQDAGDYDIQQALTQICIGSDFDGLINPIDCCNNVTELPAFRKELHRRLKRGKKIWEQAGISKSEVEVDALVEGLFFENAARFLNNWFNRSHRFSVRITKNFR